MDHLTNVESFVVAVMDVLSILHRPVYQSLHSSSFVIAHCLN